METHRPIQVSHWVEDKAADIAQELVSGLWCRGPDTEAVFEWDTGKEREAVTAYRYQGCTHVKLVGENYQHPIDRTTAIEHCEDLDALLLQGPELWGEEEYSEANQYLMHQNMLNRSLILADLHYVDIEFIDTAVNVLKQSIEERTFIEIFIRAVAEDQEEIIRHLGYRYELGGTDLTQTQMQAAIDAARTAWRQRQHPARHGRQARGQPGKHHGLRNTPWPSHCPPETPDRSCSTCDS